VLTDSFHKSALKLHSMMLLQMIDAVESGQVTAPLWDPAVVTEPGMTNPKFLRDHLFRLLSSSFPNLTPQQLQLFVAGLFAHCHDLPSFKNHLRDFLVQLREFVDKDNSDLFAEEAEAQAVAIRDAEKKKLLAIPGMIAPQNQPTWNADLDMA
jgi:exportin-1